MAEKEYIEREAFKRKLIEKSFFPAIVASALKEMPAADVVEVVRCRECKYGETITCPITGVELLICRHGCVNRAVEKDYFCSYGMRREQG